MKTKSILALLVLSSVSVSHASISTMGNVTDNGSGDYTISSGVGSVLDAALETWIGLLPGTFDSMAVTTDPDLATEGSALVKTGSMLAGDTLSFDWVWTSDEASNRADYNDFAFYSLTFQGATTLADTFVVDGTGGTVTWTAPTAGQMALAVGVVDVGDTVVDSYLNVSNVVIPEPAVAGLFAVCGVGCWGIRRFFLV